MKNLSTLASHDCLFLFDNKFYIQKDGCAMGSPIGPSFANAFLSFHEKRWLDECPLQFKPLLYRRYVDDTFLVFKHRDHIPLFLDYLNTKHTNIEFTSEIEENGCLSFLDVNIQRTENGFETSVYRKPTFTGLTTKFSSYIPLKFKRNLVSTLVYRAFQISSSFSNFHKEIKYLRQTLFKNGFPLKFTDVWVGKVLNKFYDIAKPENQTVGKKEVYISLPYLGTQSFYLRKRLSSLFNDFYPQVKLRVILHIIILCLKFF